MGWWLDVWDNNVGAHPVCTIGYACTNGFRRGQSSPNTELCQISKILDSSYALTPSGRPKTSRFPQFLIRNQKRPAHHGKSWKDVSREEKSQCVYLIPLICWPISLCSWHSCTGGNSGKRIGQNVFIARHGHCFWDCLTEGMWRFIILMFSSEIRTWQRTDEQLAEG